MATAGHEKRPRLRLLAIHAHPDDESSKGAATMARYSREGHRVIVVSCTGGEAGSILNPAMDRPGVRANLLDIRRAEMAKAAGILGVEHRWLGFADSGWDHGSRPVPVDRGCFALVPLEEAARPLVGLIRELRPHVVVTYDEMGGYPHPDHIRCHQASMMAFEAAPRGDRFPDMGVPWQPLKLYYVHEWCEARMLAFHEALKNAGLESPYGEWLKEFATKPDILARVTTHVPCGDYFEVRDEALKAHATQIDPDSHWFAVPAELQRAIWPTEEYELARSAVYSTCPESDLFAGITDSLIDEIDTGYNHDVAFS